MNPVERTRWISEQARAIGFDLCGVAPVEGGIHSTDGTFAELSHLPDWLARGYAGEMNYLSDTRRADPRAVLEGARSLVVVALNYNSAHPYSTEMLAIDYDDSPQGWISRYAWGDDYHEILAEKLKSLVAAMRAKFPEPFDARVYVDTGPIIERVAAKYAGLGWLAKNTCLINEHVGSWLFLGVIVTTLEFEPSLSPNEPPPADLCGNCTLCLDACPTQAFAAPYVLDARRCISYLTIEHRGAISEELRPQMGRAVIGCDICQDVCPWNRKAPVTQLVAFQPRKLKRAEEHGKGETEHDDSLFAPELETLASLTQQEFSNIFRGSAIKRAKWRGMIRNACIALGNAKIARESDSYERVIEILERLAASEDSVIAEHAGWALGRLGNAPQISPTAAD